MVKKKPKKLFDNQTNLIFSQQTTSTINLMRKLRQGLSYSIHISHTSSYFQGEAGFPGPRGLPGPRGEKGDQVSDFEPQVDLLLAL